MPTRSTSQATRHRMILAAEALVATRGIGGVSAREVAKAANLRNNCSVQYHFGSMEELFQEVVRFRMAQLDEVRRSMLAERLDEPGDLDVETLMKCICLAHLSIGESQLPYSYAAFLCQYLPAYHPTGFAWIMRDPDGEMPMLRRILIQLRQAIPELPADIFDRRLTSATLLFLNCYQGVTRSGGSKTLSDNAILADALRQAVAVLRAPFSN